MSGLSAQQRRLLRLALAVNKHTQGNVPRAKLGRPLLGYTIPAVDFAGPKDLRLSLAMWTFGAAELDEYGDDRRFVHDRASLTLKASLVRAMTRLRERGLIVYAPLPHTTGWGSSNGYLLTNAGMEAAGNAPLSAPMMNEACELFGLTSLKCGPQFCDRIQRRRDLIDQLNGYRHSYRATSVTVASEYQSA